MLLSKINEDDVIIGLKAKDWQDAIRKSSKTLLERGSIEEEYVDAMIDVVLTNGPYIVITKHIALAHARPELGANRIDISFALLDPAINFGVEDLDPIKLIITLAAVDSESHIALVSELAEILIDSEKVNALLDAKDNKSFCDVIRNNTVNL